jgi:hypothetical protein
MIESIVATSQSLVRFSWDLPFRLAGSLAGLSVLACLWTSLRPLSLFANLLREVGVTPDVVTGVDAWVTHHAEFVFWTGIGLFIWGVLMNGWWIPAQEARSGEAVSIAGTRGPFTAWIGLALVIQSQLPLGQLIGNGSVAVLVALVAQHFDDTDRTPTGTLEVIGWSLLNLMAAAFYIPVALALWLIGPFSDSSEAPR